MPKFLFLIIVFTLLGGSFLCEAQLRSPTKMIDLVATKKGTLSTSQSSGSGASNGACWTHIAPPTSNFLCIGSTITLNAKDDSVCCMNPQWYKDSLTNPILGATGTSLIVNSPGTYYLGAFDGSPAFCYDAITITSMVPFDTIPNESILCKQGSVTFSAPQSISNATNWQWFNNNDPIIGATSSTYTTNATGNYVVKFTGSVPGTSNCPLSSDSINATFASTLPESNITLNNTGDSCINNAITLNITTNDLYPTNITWYLNNSIIKSINNNGIVVAGGNGSGPGLDQLNQPYGIFLDASKNIYVADYGNNRIMQWAKGSNRSTIGVAIVGNVSSPTDVLVDPSSSIYVSGAISGVLEFPFPYTSSSGITCYCSTSWGLSFDQNYNLYSSNDPTNTGYTNLATSASTLNSNIIPGGNVVLFLFQTAHPPSAWTEVGTIGSGYLGTDSVNINYPNGIYVDPNFNLYVADNLPDALNNFYGRIEYWANSATSASLVAGGNGYGNAPNQIWFAAGVTVDNSGNMYVSDAINNRVQLWQPGATQGITIASGFTPWGIKVDNSDTLFVADQTNNQVLKFPSMLSNTLIANSPGDYKAVITYPGGCTETSNTITISSCLLPITLLNFEGQLKNNNAVLTWQTASEFNSSYFNIQRSIDGVNFTTIGKVNALGNSSTLHNYLYNDDNVNSLNVSKIYYRLNEIDIDGNSVQSNIISINLNESGWDFKVSPNPVKGSLKVVLNNLYGTTNITLVDIAGKKIAAQQISASGNDELNFNTDKLSGGLYIIQVLNNGQSEYLKFVKE